MIEVLYDLAVGAAAVGVLALCVWLGAMLASAVAP
jgi:hypothetical protein